ncbi:hypothetical protein ACH5RR_028844 [Cinchona calisaya]|uniref:Reverse transcriptase zinc-binding domain-containing protein n=1 Tax=Cinchona calisaya TaxID=153742 RepID=A0ABD2YPZ2_9GENT
MASKCPFCPSEDSVEHCFTRCMATQKAQLSLQWLVWIKSPVNGAKLNVDGSVIDNPGMIGYRRVLRDSNDV